MPEPIQYPGPHDDRAPGPGRFTVIVPRGYEPALVYDRLKGMAVFVLPESGFGLHRATLQNALAVASALNHGTIPFVEHA